MIFYEFNFLILVFILGEFDLKELKIVNFVFNWKNYKMCYMEINIGILSI